MQVTSDLLEKLSKLLSAKQWLYEKYDGAIAHQHINGNFLFSEQEFLQTLEAEQTEVIDEVLDFEMVTCISEPIINPFSLKLLLPITTQEDKDKTEQVKKDKIFKNLVQSLIFQVSNDDVVTASQTLQNNALKGHRLYHEFILPSKIFRQQEKIKELILEGIHYWSKEVTEPHDDKVDTALTKISHLYTAYENQIISKSQIEEIQKLFQEICTYFNMERLSQCRQALSKLPHTGGLLKFETEYAEMLSQIKPIKEAYLFDFLMKEHYLTKDKTEKFILEVDEAAKKIVEENKIKETIKHYINCMEYIQKQCGQLISLIVIDQQNVTHANSQQIIETLKKENVEKNDKGFFSFLDNYSEEQITGRRKSNIETFYKNITENTEMVFRFWQEKVGSLLNAEQLAELGDLKAQGAYAEKHIPSLIATSRELEAKIQEFLKIYIPEDLLKHHEDHKNIISKKDNLIQESGKLQHQLSNLEKEQELHKQFDQMISDNEEQRSSIRASLSRIAKEKEALESKRQNVEAQIEALTAQENTMQQKYYSSNDKNHNYLMPGMLGATAGVLGHNMFSSNSNPNNPSEIPEIPSTSVMPAANE